MDSLYLFHIICSLVLNWTSLQICSGRLKCKTLNLSNPLKNNPAYKLSVTHSSEHEWREDNEENTVLVSATPKRIFNMNDDSIFDSPKSSSTPLPKRGRPRQNRNYYCPDISVSNGLRQTLDHLVKIHSPANSPVRRSARSKNEIDRFGNPVDHTKKKKKQ